jgi:glucose-1-phosphate cytidylyltransferase
VSQTLPKPMLTVGGRPILWHLMKLYAAQGHNDFILALGWLGDEIRRFFLDYAALTSDFTVELGRQGSISYLDEHPDEGWRVTCVETGDDALTGTRVRRAARRTAAPRVMVTYGDGVGDIDLAKLLAFHAGHGRLATVTAVRPPGRFGEITFGDDGLVPEFTEKPQTSSGAVSGGFMVLEREAIERFIPEDRNVMLEREPMQALAREGQLAAYQHDGFWQPMDTPREQELLNSLWDSGKAPWKLW